MHFSPPPHTYALAIGPAVVDPPLQLLPLAGSRARLGFPSPAEDFLDDSVDLNQLLIRNGPATFLYRADGWSMLGAGVCDGDILIVDRSVTPLSGDLVLAIWDGNQPVCKVLKFRGQQVELQSAHPEHPPLLLEEGTEVEVFAVVGIVRQIKRGPSRVRAR